MRVRERVHAHMNAQLCASSSPCPWLVKVTENHNRDYLRNRARACLFFFFFSFALPKSTNDLRPQSRQRSMYSGSNVELHNGGGPPR